MREVAEAIRSNVRTLISPVPLYPFKRISPPDYHAQLYMGIETSGRPSITPERDGVLYFHVYGKREEDLYAVYDPVSTFLQAYSVSASGNLYAIKYRLASSTLLEEDDGTLHLASLFSTNYYRN